MGKTKGKTIVLLAGIAVLAFSVVTGLDWKPIAVTRYLRTQAGRQHLYEAFFDAVWAEFRIIRG